MTDKPGATQKSFCAALKFIKNKCPGIQQLKRLQQKRFIHADSTLRLLNNCSNYWKVLQIYISIFLQVFMSYHFLGFVTSNVFYYQIGNRILALILEIPQDEVKAIICFGTHEWYKKKITKNDILIFHFHNSNTTPYSAVCSPHPLIWSERILKLDTESIPTL